jgi:hypothetical protein
LVTDVIGMCLVAREDTLGLLGGGGWLGEKVRGVPKVGKGREKGEGEN